MKRDKNFEVVFNSIDEVNEFSIIRYDYTENVGDCFYLMEQSSLQILRELPGDLNINVEEIFSQRHRIAQKIQTIKSCTTIDEFLDTVVPLVENGSFPCDTLTMTIDETLKLESHDDGDVTLYSTKQEFVRSLIEHVLNRCGFDSELLNEIIQRPNVYHKLERPDHIRTSYEKFEEVLDEM